MAIRWQMLLVQAALSVRLEVRWERLAHQKERPELLPGNRRRLQQERQRQTLLLIRREQLLQQVLRLHRKPEKQLQGLQVALPEPLRAHQRQVLPERPELPEQQGQPRRVLLELPELLQRVQLVQLRQELLLPGQPEGSLQPEPLLRQPEELLQAEEQQPEGLREAVHYSVFLLSASLLL